MIKRAATIYDVSIHPRLFRRGNNKIGNSGLDKLCFNPPPPFQAREPGKPEASFTKNRFQSTPAFSGEGTPEAARGRQRQPVSIHPRLFRRGNFFPRCRQTPCPRFQSTPAFSGEGTRPLFWSSCPPPVSIHPRLFRRGNRSTRALLLINEKFQSTPAFSGEGTEHQANRDQQNSSFNPPPPFQAREQR